MKTFVRFAVTLMAVTAMCQAGFVLAEDIYFTGGQPAAPAADNQGACAESCDLSCGGCGCGPAVGGCDCDPEVGIIAAFGFDSFKGYPDGTGPSNFGVVTGLNGATPVPGLSDYGIGWQTGITYGVYDLDGALGSPAAQQQTFVTTGIFRKGREDQRLSFGLVYDWMFNREQGTWGGSPTIGQWRGQVEYALSDINAVGLYSCVRDLNNRQAVIGGYTLETRGISQVNMFWHHKFCTGADSWLWVGLPERNRLVYGGSLGDWIVGMSLQAPLSERLALYGNAEYMHPSAAAGPAATVEASWNVGAGICWYFGGNAISHSLNGKCWTPYLPVANNSTFLVDQGAYVR